MTFLLGDHGITRDTPARRQQFERQLVRRRWLWKQRCHIFSTISAKRCLMAGYHP
jgi:hypothetical protein